VKPKFVDINAWNQAELLMQPVFIRLLDNLRKQLERSPWQGTYHEVPMWSDQVPEATRTKVLELKQQLETATTEEAIAIQLALADLPQPYPSYQLRLQHAQQTVELDLWELCYQICFRNFTPAASVADGWEVEIDTDLIEAETGEIDWQSLDDKAKQLVEQIFANL